MKHKLLSIKQSQEKKKEINIIRQIIMNSGYTVYTIDNIYMEWKGYKLKYW